MRIPIKEHSNTGIVSSAVSAEYFRGNLKAFDPYGAIYGGASQVLWESTIYLAQTNGVDITDEKELTTTQVTAGKVYPAILLSYLQALRAQQNIREKCPIFIANISSSDGIFTEDEWWFELNMANNGKYPSVQGIEDFIQRINPYWKLEYEYPLLNFPAMYFVQWVPNKTTAEMRSLRVLLATYAESYQTFCNLCKIKTKTLDAQNFIDRQVTEFQPWSFQDKDWLFWNASGAYMSIRNGADLDYNLFTARNASPAEIFDVSTANWLSARDKYYLVPKDGKPSDLNAVIQMFYPYHANNLLGSAVPDDGGGFNDNTLEAADVFAAKLSRNDPASTNDTAAQAVDRGEIRQLFNAFPSMFSDQPSNAAGVMSKLTEEAGEPASPTYLNFTGGHRCVNYDTAIWDNTNGLLVQNFFQEKFFGKGSKDVNAPIGKFFRKQKTGV